MILGKSAPPSFSFLALEPLTRNAELLESTISDIFNILDIILRKYTINMK